MRATLLLLLPCLLLAGCSVHDAATPPTKASDSAAAPTTYNLTFRMEPAMPAGTTYQIAPVRSAADVATFVEHGPDVLGMPGDIVVSYLPGNHSLQPRVARAIAYVEVHPNGNVSAPDVRVRWNRSVPCEGGAAPDPERAGWCDYEGTLVLPSIGLWLDAAKLQGSAGFVTKVDNYSDADQVVGRPLVALPDLAGTVTNVSRPPGAGWEREAWLPLFPLDRQLHLTILNQSDAGCSDGFCHATLPVNVTNVAPYPIPLSPRIFEIEANGSAAGLGHPPSYVDPGSVPLEMVLQPGESTVLVLPFGFADQGDRELRLVYSPTPGNEILGALVAPLDTASWT